MKLARGSHQRLEKFFREYFNDPELRLPRIYLHRGLLARLITKRLKVEAITIGRHIFLSPQRVTVVDGCLSTKGWLVAHEAAHVLQYEREGYTRFLFRYFYGYLLALRGNGRWNREVSMNAYLAIEAERVAHDVERAYQAWSEATHTRIKAGFKL